MKQGLSVLSATLIMITSMMGSGVVMMPMAMSSVGYVTGLIMLIIVPLFAFFTLIAISSASLKYIKDQENNVVNATEMQNLNTKQDDKALVDPEVQATVAPANDKIVSYYNVTRSHSPVLALVFVVSVIAQGLGSCLTYLIALQTWIPLLLDTADISHFIILGVSFFPLYFLAMQRNLSRLKYASYLAVGAVVYLLVLCVYYYFVLRNCTDCISEEHIPVSFNDNYYAAIGIIIFALGCHQNIVQTFYELKNKTMKNITLVSLFCILGGATIYLTIGMAGYFAVGSGIKSPILEVFSNPGHIDCFMRANTFDKYGILAKIGLGGFLCVIICSFPLQMHPSRDNVINLLSEITCIRNWIRRKEGNGLMLNRIITTILTVAVYGVASIPDLEYGSVINIIGATATNAVTYIVPGLLYCYCVKEFNFKTAICGLISLAGIILMVYMLYNQFTTSKVLQNN